MEFQAIIRQCCFLINPAVLFAISLLLLGTMTAFGDEKGGDGPGSVPFGAMVEANLKAKREIYKIKTGGMSFEEYRKVIHDGELKSGGGFPKPPEVEMVLELTNTSDQEVKIQTGGTRNVIKLKLDGPGAETVVFKGRAMPRFVITSTAITLAPGKKETVPITTLGFGLRNMTHAAYWTLPGEYTLSASYDTAINPFPKDSVDVGNGFGSVVLKSDSIKLIVK